MPSTAQSGAGEFSVRWVIGSGVKLRARVVAGNLGPLLIAAMLIGSAGSEEGQPGGAEQAAGAETVPGGCGSVVLVSCAQDAAASADSRQATGQKLQSRRLQQVQAQAGLDTVEVTAERPTEVPPDSWEAFTQSVSSAAVPDCFAKDTLPAVQGLLRPPVLLHSAAVGKCR
jgi:hypothetical protein